MPEIEILVRNRFVPLPDATARRTRANAWEVRIPRTDAVAKAIRGKVELETFDDAVFAIDGEESLQAIGASGDAREVVVTVLLP